MNKICMLLSLALLLVSCANSDYKKEQYIKEKLPFIVENLTDSQMKEFKEEMVLNFKGVLTSYSYDLLEIGAGSRFDSVIINISRDLGGGEGDIIIVESDGTERVIQ